MWVYVACAAVVAVLSIAATMGGAAMHCPQLPITRLCLVSIYTYPAPDSTRGQVKAAFPTVGAAFARASKAGQGSAAKQSSTVKESPRKASSGGKRKAGSRSSFPTVQAGFARAGGR